MIVECLDEWMDFLLAIANISTGIIHSYFVMIMNFVHENFAYALANCLFV
jgi:hypothetical protein